MCLLQSISSRRSRTWSECVWGGGGVVERERDLEAKSEFERRFSCRGRRVRFRSRRRLRFPPPLSSSIRSSAPALLPAPRAAMRSAQGHLSTRTEKRPLRPRRALGAPSLSSLCSPTDASRVGERRKRAVRAKIKKTHLLRKQVRGGRLEASRDDGRDDGPLLGRVGVPVARGDKGPGEGAGEGGHVLIFSFRPSVVDSVFFFRDRGKRKTCVYLLFPVFLAPSR